MESIANLLPRLASGYVERDVVDAGDGNRATFPSDRAIWGDFGNHRGAWTVFAELERVRIAGVCMTFAISWAVVVAKESVVNASTRKLRSVKGGVGLLALLLLSKPRIL